MTRTFQTNGGHPVDPETMDEIAEHVRAFDKSLTPEHKIASATRHLADELPRLRGELHSAVQMLNDHAIREHRLAERRTVALEILALSAVGKNDTARRSRYTDALVQRYTTTEPEDGIS